MNYYCLWFYYSPEGYITSLFFFTKSDTFTENELMYIYSILVCQISNTSYTHSALEGKKNVSTENISCQLLHKIHTKKPNVY